MKRHISRGLLALAGVGLLLASCGDDGEEADPAVRAQILERFAPAANEYQREILEDGVVTYDEYEAAFYAMLACLEDKGFTIVEGPEYRGGQFTAVTSFPGEEPHFDEECSATYVDFVDGAWFLQNQPSEAELQEVARVFRRCLAEKGWDVDANSSTQEVQAIWMSGGPASDAEFVACQDFIEEQYELLYSG